MSKEVGTGGRFDIFLDSADRPCVHTRPPLSDPVWVCYPY